ncbi:calcium-binding protein [Ideonella sp.]|uniref:calcium-binding protein n=1 Tax=Ideonella sp. TaxID=1929293 RepID=UPI0035B3A050
MTADDIFGTEGDDDITPTSPPGSPHTTNGDDRVFALGGDDRVVSGQGRDWVDGGLGNDTLLATDADDTLIGGAGDDELGAAYGNPYLHRATLLGGDGNDRMNILGSGAQANNLLDGGAGDDLLIYSSDSYGGDNSTILGGEGNDRIVLMAPGITVDAGAGDDVVRFTFDGDLVPTNGNITLGAGRDTVVADDPTGGGYDLNLVPRLMDFAAGAGGDRLDLDALTRYFGDGRTDSNPFLDGRLWFTQEGGEAILRSAEGAELRLYGVDPAQLTADNITAGYDPHGDLLARNLQGGSGNDALLGADGNDSLVGGAGDDLLDGLLGGADRLSGGAGQDTLLGFSGADVLRGDGGRDVLFGGSGNDTLLGGAGNDDAAWSATVHGVALSGAGLVGGDGNDLVLGGGGRDHLSGHRGNDVLFGGSGNDVLVGDGFNGVWHGGETDNDVFVFSGALDDGVDRVLDFGTAKHAHDVIDLSLFFGAAGATVIDGQAEVGDDFDPLSGPVDTTGQNVLSLEAVFGHPPKADEVAALLQGSRFEAGQRQAVLVHDSAQGAEGQVLLYVGVDSATDDNQSLDAGELRLIGVVRMADTPFDTNGFEKLTADQVRTGGSATAELLAPWQSEATPPVPDLHTLVSWGQEHRWADTVWA